MATQSGYVPNSDKDSHTLVPPMIRFRMREAVGR